MGVGSASLSDTSSAAFLALPNGSSWLDATTGERITKIKGQPILDGGCLYYRKVNFQSATLTSTPTVVDAGTNAARGGLKPIIKAGYFNSNHQKIFGKIGLGGSFTDTATQWIMCEVLIGSVVAARARIDPTLIPGIAVNPSGRVWDLSFDLETVDLPVSNWASVNMRGHCVAEGGFAATTGSGSTRSMLGYTFPLEVYTNSPTIDWTVDNLLTVRVSASGSGPTIYVNSVMYWV